MADSGRLINTAPGKVFLCGEYLALSGGPALVVATSPRFGWQEKQGAQIKFHPSSPAARALGREEFVGSEFLDPFHGQGGFGASTAQFIFSQLFVLRELGWQELWKRYRAVSMGSGMDLVTQALGGWCQISFSDEQIQVERRTPSSEFARSIHLFSATHQSGRKTPTHEVLKREGLSAEKQERLRDLMLRVILSLSTENPVELGGLLTEYAQVLSEFGLEAEASTADRKYFLSQPGVYGAKGCGAQLSDAMLVVCDSSQVTHSRVLRWAQERDLRWMGALSADEPGVLQ